MTQLKDLSRRERQIMDVLFVHGEATVKTIRQQMPDPPSATAIRTFLHILQDKGFVTRRREGREYLYKARAQRRKAGQAAMSDVIDTFFDGSLEQALSAHLANHKSQLSDADLKRLRQMIEKTRTHGG
jgi:predicted transcriptional regulator